MRSLARTFVVPVRTFVRKYGYYAEKDEDSSWERKFARIQDAAIHTCNRFTVRQSRLSDHLLNGLTILGDHARAIDENVPFPGGSGLCSLWL